MIGQHSIQLSGGVCCVHIVLDLKRTGLGKNWFTQRTCLCTVVTLLIRLQHVILPDLLPDIAHAGIFSWLKIAGTVLIAATMSLQIVFLPGHVAILASNIGNNHV